MDTLGNLIDKLYTVNLKFCYINDDNKKLNLEIQKSKLSIEIDDLLNDILCGYIEKDDIIRPQHKTY